jgi:pyruvate dehydrogenase E1 component beta subunit
VVDLISLKPFDMETISKSIKKTRRVGTGCYRAQHGCGSAHAPPWACPDGRAESWRPLNVAAPAAPSPPPQAIIVEECMKTGGIGASLSAVIHESLFNELDHEVGGGGAAPPFESASANGAGGVKRGLLAFAANLGSIL